MTAAQIWLTIWGVVLVFWLAAFSAAVGRKHDGDAP